MNILVTGNLGYIGSILTSMLHDLHHEVTGLDTGYYSDCLLYPAHSQSVSRQIIKDIRDITMEDLKGIEAVIHLAALSNDPLGQFSPNLTDDINFKATVAFAELSKKAHIKRFIYSSSQSMYGISESQDELEEDNSIKNPLTAYAKTKWAAECAIKDLTGDGFHPVFYRPSTVFGISPRLRCDIVYNNLVACAFTTGKIEIKSDGTPWRPVIHIRDVCNALISGINAPSKLVSGQAFNVGIHNGNFTVRDLAEAAQNAVPGSELVFTGEHGNDSRTYKVSFKKILTILKDYFKPEWDLKRGGEELVTKFREINLTQDDFRGRKVIRLEQLKHLMNENQIDDSFKWIL